MVDSIRTFIAVKVSALPLLRPVLQTLNSMRHPIAAVPPNKLHVTLKFLGETPLKLCDTVQKLMAQTVAMQSPIVLRVVGLGAFPHVDRPSVVWAGLNDVEPLVTLANELNAVLEPLGFVRESRPFQPHLTLARIKGRPPSELFELLQRHAATDFGAVAIQSIEFIRSDLDPGGARYSTLATSPLS